MIVWNLYFRYMTLYVVFVYFFFVINVVFANNYKIIDGSNAKIFYHYDLKSKKLITKNIGNEIIYQIFIDRFFNGNLNNDCLYNGNFCVKPNNSSWQNWFKYHGGDLEGIIYKLSYIKNLGISTILITPIFENQQVNVNTYVYNQLIDISSYHGYWINDWFRLNPFFTNNGNEDYYILTKLINMAQPQLKIILDTVFNHSSPLIATEESLQYLHNIIPIPPHPLYPRSHKGAIFEKGIYFSSHYEDVYRVINEQDYIPIFHHHPLEPYKLIECDDWDNSWVVENCNLGGLTDINQDNPKMYDYFIRAHEFWLKNFGIVGYRLDTIKHVNHNFWVKFLEDLYSKYPDIITIGEYFDGGPLEPNSYNFYINTPSTMFDFNFRAAIYSVFVKDKSFGEILKVWESDSLLSDARYLITFLDSHDLPRIRGDQKGAISFKRLEQAIALWLVSRGIPCIYYGLEQDLFVTNDKGDPFNRPMMVSFDQTYPLYILIQKLNLLRRNNLALRYGHTQVLYYDNDILAFERVFKDNVVLFITSKKSFQDEDLFLFKDISLKDGIYVNLMNELEQYSINNNTLKINIKGGNTYILYTSFKN